MKALYLSLFCPQPLLEEIRKISGTNPGYAGQKFDYLMIKGLIKNGVECDALSSIPINRRISKKLFWNKKNITERGIKFKLIPFINFPILHQLCLFVYTFNYVLFWGITKRKEKFIIADVLNFTICAAALIASKLIGIKSIGVVTDMPGFLVNAAGGKSDSISRNKKLYSIMKQSIFHYDGYVFLTEQMNSVINKKYKPYIVMEGLVDSEIPFDENRVIEGEERIILYAGGLHERYGLKTLVEAFIKLTDENLRFWIFGSGPFADDLKNIYCKKDKRIIYKGIRPNNEVVEAELKATLLVNPRPTHEEFTKYSFPSKNMEYMVSGTPVLTTRLPGMPKEYYPYIFIFDEETLNGYEKKLNEVLQLSQESLEKKGKAAKEWILNNKNNRTQTSRILALDIF